MTHRVECCYCNFVMCLDLTILDNEYLLCHLGHLLTIMTSCLNQHFRSQFNIMITGIKSGFTQLSLSISVLLEGLASNVSLVLSMFDLGHTLFADFLNSKKTIKILSLKFHHSLGGKCYLCFQITASLEQGLMNSTSC